MSGEVESLEGRLRTAFQHILFLGSRDVDSSKWYAEELAKIAIREFAAESANLGERGRQLASQREDLIAQGVNPADLLVPLAPDAGTNPLADAWRAGYLKAVADNGVWTVTDAEADEDNPYRVPSTSEGEGT